MRFSKLLLLGTLALWTTGLSFGVALAKDKKFKKGFNKVEVTSRDETDVFDHNKNIERTKFDEDIDIMIFDQLGEDYRRANVYDLYPIEVKEHMSTKEKMEMLEYYDYMRKELESISRSKLIKVVKKDLTLNGKNDYAVLVRNLKKDENYLAIINFENTHYIEPFQEHFLELVNYGDFPNTVVTKDNKTKTISNPVIKLVSLEPDKNKVLYYDKAKKKWKEIEVKL